jgi:RNA polymerase sigma factor (TIGR02999 family)
LRGGRDGDQTIQLQGLIAHLVQGDDGARHELIRCAYERLRGLAAVLLNESFPGLKKAPALLDTTELANEAALKLYDALADVRPESAGDFFRLAAQRMRWLLLDLARRTDRSEKRMRERPVPVEDEAAPSNELPDTLTALYEQIEGLPEQERQVVDLLHFHGLSQREAAALLGVAERTVRRHWAAARIRLFDRLKHFLPVPATPDQAP